MATQKKIDTVQHLTEKISKSKSMVFADYTGLTHKKLEELRTLLAATESEFVVTKNKLMERALGKLSDSAKSELKNATATLFAFGDEVVPLKVMLKFFKTAGFGKTKGGFLGQNPIDSDGINRLSLLPNRDMMLGRLAGQLYAPIQGLHRALSWNINKLVWALDGIRKTKSS